MPGAKALLPCEIERVTQALGSSRDRCLFALGLATGFRVSELLSLTREDVWHNSAPKGSVAVRRANMKGKAASRSVPLSQGAKEAILNYFEQFDNSFDENSRLFPFTRQHAARILAHAYKAAGLGEGYSTHSMRKTFAKRVYEKLGRNLVNTQRAMGHKSVNSTVAYLAVDQEAIDRAITDDA